MERRCFFRFFALPPYFFGISSCYFFTFSALFMRFALFAPGVQAAALPGRRGDGGRAGQSPFSPLKE